MATVALPLALALPACGSTTPATQLLLVVDSDMAVPSQLDQVMVVVTHNGGTMLERSANLADGSISFPLVLTLAPADTSALGALDITVSGQSGGATVVTRQVRTTFVRNKGRALYVFLRGVCRGTSCGADQTCGNEGSCVGVDVDPATLPEFKDEVPGFDAGTATCTPTGDEICDGADNDCDGTTDEGDAATLCPAGTNVVGTSCTDGVCTIDSCVALTGSCDPDFANGCETTLVDNPMHCGMCGNACGAMSSCRGTSCVEGGWAVAFGGPGATDAERVNDIAIDAEGNVYVVGGITGTLAIGGMMEPSIGRMDSFLLKFGPDGSRLGMVRMGGSDNDEATQVEVDDAGNVYVLGTFTGTAMFGGAALTSAGAGRDLWLGRYKATDLSHTQSISFGSMDDDSPMVMTGTGAGQLHIAAFAPSAVVFGANTVQGLVLVRMNGADLTPVWSKGFGTVGDGGNRIADIAVDEMDRVFLLGHHVGAVNFGTGGSTFSGAGVFLANLRGADGAHRWSRSVVPGGASTMVGAVADGDAYYITGSFASAISFGGGNITSMGSRDTFMASVDQARGDLVWQRGLGGPTDVTPVNIAVGATGSIYLTPNFVGTVRFLTKTIAGIGGDDVLVIGIPQNADRTGPDSADGVRGRPLGTMSGDEVARVSDFRDGTLCIAGTFDASGEIDLLSTPPGTRYASLGTEGRITGTAPSESFLTCFATAALPFVE